MTSSSRGRLLNPACLVGVLASLLVTGVSHAQPDGHALFVQNCSACHQPEGQGIPGALPRRWLATSSFRDRQKPWLQSFSTAAEGCRRFPGDLSNETIASILSYVRDAWGNKAGPLTPAAVASVRAASGVEHAGSALQSH